MRKVSILVLILSLFVVTSFSFSQDPGHELLMNRQNNDVYSVEAYKAIVDVMGQVDPDFKISWNEQQGVPSSVTGAVNARVDVVKILQNKLPEGVSLELIKMNDKHSVYQYRAGMVKVFPATVTYSEASDKFMIAGAFVFNNEVKNGVSIDMKTAEKIASDYISVDMRTEVIHSERVMFDTKDGLLNSYLVKIQSRNPMGDFVVVVDADSSDVVYCDNMLAFYQGEGKVFPTNPLKSNPTIVNINNIRNEHTLYGNWVNVKNEDNDNAYEEDDSFIYALQNTHFDEVGTYYYINSIHDYFKNTFGYDGLDKSMKATVHYGTNYDNAFFSPWGQYFCFGDGSRFNDLAREASVTYHEYTHAVSYEIAGLGTSGEAGAINEALSDYFGNSLTDDPNIGEWVVAKMGRDYLRSCINDTHYPEDVQNECHADSLMFSAPLWEMREALGKEVTDYLAHNMRYHINSRSTFADGLAALLLVDEEKYGGVHKNRIIRIFANRGITENDKIFRSRMQEKMNVENIY